MPVILPRVTSGASTVGSGFVASSTARAATPASLSAISLTSSFVSTSVTRTPLLDIRIVAGPWNCRKSLSPRMDLLVAVRRPKRARAIVLYKSVLRIAVMKLDKPVGTRVVMKLVIEAGRAGICTLNGLVLRSRNGSGGFLSIEYAVTWLGCSTISSPSASVTWCRIEKVVFGEAVPINAVMGVVDVMRW
ncbi:hypothetical protein PspLS_01861 [Pyricularia sp. CBS 133598]|nr:hypothetical protein PspLS_01861 [Pyricularia sp. CBS 133598]